MIAVYKRELRAYLNNVYGWLFAAVLLMFIGAAMFLSNLMELSPDFQYALINGEYVFLIMIPILCMRSMSEDRHNKTDMFYLSLPMKTASVVLGKYLALLTVFAVPCLVICVYPLVLGMFGTVTYSTAYISILFFFLLGAGLIAVCQFCSSLTDNMVVSAVLGVVAVLVLFFLPYLAGFIPTTAIATFIGLVVIGGLMALIAFLTTHNLNVTAITGAAVIVPVSVLYIVLKDKFAGLLPSALSFVSPFLHFQEVSFYGIFSIPSLILMLSYPLFFVFLTVQSADKKRWA